MIFFCAKLSHSVNHEWLCALSWWGIHVLTMSWYSHKTLMLRVSMKFWRITIFSVPVSDAINLIFKCWFRSRAALIATTFFIASWDWRLPWLVHPLFLKAIWKFGLMINQLLICCLQHSMVSKVVYRSFMQNLSVQCCLVLSSFSSVARLNKQRCTFVMYLWFERLETDYGLANYLKYNLHLHFPHAFLNASIQILLLCLWHTLYTLIYLVIYHDPFG